MFIKGPHDGWPHQFHETCVIADGDDVLICDGYKSYVGIVVIGLEQMKTNEFVRRV